MTESRIKRDVSSKFRRTPQHETLEKTERGETKISLLNLSDGANLSYGGCLRSGEQFLKKNKRFQ